MNKKRAFICWMILYGLGIVAFIVGLSLPDDISRKIIGLVFTLFIMFILGGSVMGCIYAHLKRKEKQDTLQYDDRAFQCWLNRYNPYIRTGAKLTKTEDSKFSKFGGLPQTPANFSWPIYKNRALPFLLQIDFAEINADGRINDFPTSGLLYLFVDSSEINDPSFEQGEEEYAQGRAFQILFFEKSDDLSYAKKPDDLDTYYKEFHVCAETVTTYPDIDDCREACDIYCNRPFGGMDDEYDDLQGQNMSESLLGGWASYIQSSKMADECNSKTDTWVLLAQIASVSDDEKLMWGDSGTLYFYIRKSDLLAHRFDRVKLDMQCY